MEPLTPIEINEIVKTQQKYVRFTPDSLIDFIRIWEERLNDAILYHKREDLAQQARRLIAFAKKSTAGDLGLYTCNWKSIGRVGFIYNRANHEFLQIGERP
jgi:hypothetical protein